jgi:hypothetical protein
MKKLCFAFILLALIASVSSTLGIASGENDPLKNCPLKKGDPLSKVKEFYRVSYDPQESGPRVPGSFYYAYDFPKYGVSVFFDNLLQVLTLRFDRPFSGKIDGISIGDTKEQVVKLKGEPLRKFQSPDFKKAQENKRTSLNEVWVYESESEFFRCEFGSSSNKLQTILSSRGN